MEDQGSTASTYECFRTPTLREIWKRYRSFATGCYYQHNAKNIKESPDVHVTATQEKKHAIKRDRRRRHPKALDDRSNGHHEEVKIRGDNLETCRYNYYSDPTLNNNDGILHEGVDTFSRRRHHEDGHQRGCLKALLVTTTRSKYGAGPQQPQGPATISGSTLTPGSDVEGSMEREEMTRASTVERKTTKSMGRTQSESAAQWTAKRARSERRATSAIRRASSAIGTEGRPQRRSSFNGRMVTSNGGGGRSDVWGSSSTSMIYGRSSSICSNSSGQHHHVIMFSSSSGLLKPPSIEQALECTLEELCFGCVKKMRVTRDVISGNGQIRKEEEVLKINVKPGWKGGTKITFPGVLRVMNRPGDYAADVVFTVIQIPHPVFTSEDDDLIMDIGIPLANALTGCSFNIPLLGGGDHGDMSMDIDIEHVVYPGFEKIIPGQGMPDRNQPQCRGNLRIRFHVQFPNMLTHAQRSEIFGILNTVS